MVGWWVGRSSISQSVKSLFCVLTYNIRVIFSSLLIVKGMCILVDDRTLIA